MAVTHPSYLLDEALFVEGVEGDVEVAQFQDDATERPDISPTVITFTSLIRTIKNLRTLIKQGTNILDPGACSDTADSKIADLHLVILALKKYIARFNVPMNNFLGM